MSGLFVNPRMLDEVERRRRCLAAFPPALFQAALTEIGGWPGYAPTPLLDFASLASDLRLGSVAVKDEGARLGLGSFKALGGSYAVVRLALDRLRPSLSEIDGGQLLAGGYSSGLRDLVVASATAGNHGLSLAWAARRIGLRCVLFLGAGVSAARQARLEALGAEIVRVDGNYDASVEEARRRSEAEGWVLVSDTCDEGEDGRLPGLIMTGYCVLLEEALRQQDPRTAFTHLFVQAGVGGLAAAAAAHLIARLSPAPIVVVVEPSSAGCLMESARVGRAVTLATPLATDMSCLACARPSALAEALLTPCANAFLSVEDDAAAAAVRALAAGRYGPAVAASTSGAAGLAGVMIAAGDPEWRDALALSPSSHVLAIVTESRIGNG